jgi:putative ABC transport system substrate-binding protein
MEPVIGMSGIVHADTKRREVGRLTDVSVHAAVILALIVMSGIPVGVFGATERLPSIKIGALTDSWGPTPSIVGLRDGLIERGYRQGTQFEIGVRFTQGDVSALSAAAQDLVRDGVDIIFVMGANAAKAAQKTTHSIPIVFAGAVGDPVQLGLVRSFARPGGNITGVTDLDIDLAPKRLEILQAMLPGLKRVLFAYDPRDAYGAATVRGYRAAARRLGIALVERTIRSEDDARDLVKLRKGEVDGVLGASTLSMNIPGLLVEAASRHGIPSMFNDLFWVERLGALASYGPDLYESGRLAARLVDKILKGADPADVPIEANPKIELALNMKTAKALGLAIPPAIILRADRLVQ